MEQPKRNQPNFRASILIIPALCLLLAGVSVVADDLEIKPDHPDRYTVQKGDTLWDIANRFLKSPWQWAKVWKGNDQIKNPHLIYPGDVIVLNYVNGQPVLSVLQNEKVPAPVAAPLGEAAPQQPATAVVTAPAALPPPQPGSTGRTEKLPPSIQVRPLGGAIPTISPNAITPFLTYPLAVDQKELDSAAYVSAGLDDRLALGDQSEFYARGLKSDDEYYYIYRPGRAIRNPDTKEILGYEAIYLGDAKLLEPGDPAKLIVTRVKQEILPTDRLLPAPANVPLPYYYPAAPSKQVKGRIASALEAVEEVGSYGIVALTLGSREGMEEGHVLRVMRHVGTARDPVTRKKYELPDEESALVMIFRVYEKVSYALVLNSTRPVHVLDVVITP